MTLRSKVSRWGLCQGCREKAAFGLNSGKRVSCLWNICSQREQFRGVLGVTLLLRDWQASVMGVGRAWGSSPKPGPSSLGPGGP